MNSTFTICRCRSQCRPNPLHPDMCFICGGKIIPAPMKDLAAHFVGGDDVAALAESIATVVAGVVANAVAAEREACAKVADEWEREHGPHIQAPAYIAAAIRQRGLCSKTVGCGAPCVLSPSHDGRCKCRRERDEPGSCGA